MPPSKLAPDDLARVIGGVNWRSVVRNTMRESTRGGRFGAVVGMGMGAAGAGALTSYAGPAAAVTATWVGAATGYRLGGWVGKIAGGAWGAATEIVRTWNE